MSFSSNIKQFRLAKGLTQEQLAERLGISAQAISKWETSETYPDGALLVPLAQALDVSLDALFGNDVCTMQDISTRIRNLIADTPEAERMHLCRDICWQIEKGLFNCRMSIDDSYDPEEIKKKKAFSYILSDYGFTYICNDQFPFFTLFPQYDDTLGDTIGNGQKLTALFSRLSRPETMLAILWLFKKNEGFVFEATRLCSECAIGDEVSEIVIGDLLFLELIQKMDVALNNEVRTLYTVYPSHKLLALFILALALLNPRKSQSYMSHYRTKPLLK